MKNILVYGVDGIGYGHIVKMTNLVNELRNALPQTHFLFVSGYLQIQNFLPNHENVDYVKLPSFSNIQIENRHKHDVVKRVENMRKDILNAILFNQQFDAIIVDFFPFGKRNELWDALLAVKDRFSHTRIILTFRGIAFSKQRTLDFFQGERGLNFINTVYNGIACLSDERIIEINREYFDGKIRIPIGYHGYLIDKRTKIDRIKKTNLIEIVVNFGGGYGCDELVVDLMKELTGKERECKITLVLGEYFKDETLIGLEHSHSHDTRVTILKKLPLEASRQIYADIHIGKGGYNATAEALFNNIPVIIIPTLKDEESELYGKRIEQYGNVRLLYPSEVKKIWTTIHTSLEAKQSCQLRFFGQDELNRIIDQMKS